MKTTIDIPDADLADAMKFTGAKTKREAVVRAMQEFNRLERVRLACALFGTFESMMTNDEIEAADVAEIPAPNG